MAGMDGDCDHQISTHDWIYFPPAGYKFEPTDQELVGYYLKRKIEHLQIPINLIPEVNLYDYHPDQLKENFGKWFKDTEDMYFFTKRERLPRGNRPSRAARNGYWKAFGGDQFVVGTNRLNIGFKKTLAFRQGKSPKGFTTKWVMHEYRLREKEENHPKQTKMDIVLCRILERKRGGKSEEKGKDHKGDDQMNGRCSMMMSKKALFDIDNIDQEYYLSTGSDQFDGFFPLYNHQFPCPAINSSHMDMVGTLAPTNMGLLTTEEDNMYASSLDRLLQFYGNPDDPTLWA